MKTFNLYTHPETGSESVKAGFSWPAFFFGVFWMLSKKLWKYAALLFFMYVSLNALEGVSESYLDEQSIAGVYRLTLLASLALCLVPGFQGNKWREADLRKRGYVLKDTQHEESPDAATAQAFRVP